MSDNVQVQGLEQASAEVKLAVDLIMLLETNQIAADVALAALEIVKSDLESKLSAL
ncbi:pleiotropic regulatory protein RsmS [Shewanella sp. 125m-7]